MKSVTFVQSSLMNKINVILCEIKSFLNKLELIYLPKCIFSNSLQRVLHCKAGKQRRATSSSTPAFVENKAGALTAVLCETHNSQKGSSESISQNCHKILSAPAVMKKYSLVNMIKVHWNLKKTINSLSSSLHAFGIESLEESRFWQMISWHFTQCGLHFRSSVSKPWPLLFFSLLLI